MVALVIMAIMAAAASVAHALMRDIRATVTRTKVASRLTVYRTFMLVHYVVEPYLGRAREVVAGEAVELGTLGLGVDGGWEVNGSKRKQGGGRVGKGNCKPSRKE